MQQIARIFVSLAVVCGATNLPAPACSDEVVSQLIDDIDLTKLDELIEDAELLIMRLKAQQNTSSDAFSSSDEQDKPNPDQVALTRSRGDLLCFANSLGPQKSRVLLDNYFSRVETGLNESLDLMRAFSGLTNTYAQSECPSFMLDMATSATTQIKAFPRAEMAELVLHLETCWPDEGETEADGTQLNMDARYYHARELMGQMRRVTVLVNDANEWCG